MLLSLNPSNGVPIYRQVIQQLRERILSGQMPAGEQLPSVRDLSVQLSINPLTAAKVYQHLEREGLVESRRGQGTFVAVIEREFTSAERRKQIDPAIRQLVTEALHLGMDLPSLQQAVEKSYFKLKGPSSDE
jgi:GntR family transcriptional regulator